MDENPYQAPETTTVNDQVPSPGPTRNAYLPLLYAGAGFVVGTVLISPLILSLDAMDQLIGGAMYGGPCGALAGYFFGRRMLRKGS